MEWFTATVSMVHVGANPGTHWSAEIVLYVVIPELVADQTRVVGSRILKA